jgi:tetratricopeptide (TPR) repeat protein
VGVLDDLALSGIDRIERSLGKRAALRALVPLIDTLPAGRARARGLLRAIEYAAEVDDPELVERLCARWSIDGVGVEARRSIRRLLGAGRASAAVELARAELGRARAHDPAERYVLGRCLEAAGRLLEARLEYAEVARTATKEPRLRQTACAREVRVLLALGARGEAAPLAARSLPLERAAPEDRLAVAVAALEAPGRYRRAAALDVLESLARAGGELGRQAARFAALHADRSGTALSSIEVDRVAAVLRVAGSPEAAARVFAVRAGAPADGCSSDFLRRARAVAEGNAAGARPAAASGREVVGWLGLAACAAVRARARAEAREHLRELTDRVRRGARAEAPVWTAVLIALGDGRIGDVARELAAALLAGNGEPPPRGYACLAEALDAAGASELAIEAWRRATARREPNARERLASIVRYRGWQAAQEGDRDKAISLLREARRIAGAARA